ncbi:MAG: amidohydrolase family protein [Thermodesulfobacteriota bacterium]
MAPAAGMPVVDADGHVYESAAEIYDFLPAPYAGRATVLGFPLWPTPDGFQRGAIHARLGLHRSFDVDARAWLDFLDAAGIGATVLYPTAGLATGMIRDPDWAVALCRAYNDWLAARFLAASPRLGGVALLPLQDPSSAAEELRRAATTLGMVGGVLPAVGLSRALGDAAFDPVYEEAQRLDVPVAVHGGPSQGLALERLRHFGQVHALAHPFAQMMQLTSVLMSGVLDRFPRLRIAFLEAGVGWVPYLLERMDRAFHVRRFPEYVGGVQGEPSTYVRGGRVYFTPEPGESGLAAAVTAIGPGALLFASDFPHEVNLERCREELGHLARRDDVGPDVRRALLGENARRFYRLRADDVARAA